MRAEDFGFIELQAALDDTLVSRHRFQLLTSVFTVTRIRERSSEGVGVSIGGVREASRRVCDLGFSRT